MTGNTVATMSGGFVFGCLSVVLLLVVVDIMLSPFRGDVCTEVPVVLIGRAADVAVFRIPGQGRMFLVGRFYA